MGFALALLLVSSVARAGPCERGSLWQRLVGLKAQGQASHMPAYRNEIEALARELQEIPGLQDTPMERLKWVAQTIESQRPRRENFEIAPDGTDFFASASQEYVVWRRAKLDEARRLATSRSMSGEFLTAWLETPGKVMSHWRAELVARPSGVGSVDVAGIKSLENPQSLKPFQDQAQAFKKTMADGGKMERASFDGTPATTRAAEKTRDELFLREGVSPSAVRNLKSIEVYRVTQAPRSLKADPHQFALRHPEMNQALTHLEEMGFELWVDPGLPLARMGAYHHPVLKRIALAPDAPWSVFVHEYQHALFSDSGLRFVYRAALEDAKQGVPVSQIFTPAELAHFESRGVRVDTLLQSLKRQLPLAAADETGAVAAELAGIGFKKMTHDDWRAKLYALDWQIREFEVLGTWRTNAQTRSYYRALAERALWLGLSILYPNARGVLLGAGGAAVVGAAVVAAFYNEKLGLVILQMSDGTIQTTRIDSLEKKLRKLQKD